MDGGAPVRDPQQAAYSAARRAAFGVPSRMGRV
jgi:hypothetical protein